MHFFKDIMNAEKKNISNCLFVALFDVVQLPIKQQTSRKFSSAIHCRQEMTNALPYMSENRKCTTSTLPFSPPFGKFNVVLGEKKR